MPSLKIYKASAGSGKTFTLAREYLFYLVKNPLVYKNILAVTFTNKATAEMKERILTELFLLSYGKESDHLEYLVSKTGMDEKVVRENAGLAFNGILHDFSNFSVSTIDSFFQKIFRSFLYELGIKFNFDLLLNDSEVLEEAVKQFLENLQPEEPSTEWLLQFIQERMEEGKSYRIEDELVKSGKEIFKEQFVEFQQELFEKITDKTFLNSYKDSLKSIIEKVILDLRKIGIGMMEEIVQSGLDINDFSNKASGVAGYIYKLSIVSSDNITSVFEPGVRTLNASTDPQNWTTKNSTRRNEIIALVENSLLAKLNEVLAMIKIQKAQVYTARLILKNLFNLGLLAEISKEAKKYTFQNGYFLLAEIPRFLAEVIGTDGAPFVYEKAGTRYTHYMIDEFQDTSQMQYANFKPLVENSLSQGYGNLVVGDVKQSIYRWRNSDWQLLESQLRNDFAMFSPKEINLEENYRSKPNVISFNNALYSIIPEMSTGILENDQNSKERIIKLYSESIQKQPRQNYSDKGYVGVQFYSSDDYKDEVADSWMPSTVLFWWKRGLRDIAVLVRENRDIPIVFNSISRYIKKELEGIPSDFRVISGESLSLTASGAVNFLVSLLRYSINPDDMVNQGVLLHEYQFYLSNNEQNPDAWFNSKDSDIKNKIPELSDQTFTDALTLPFYEMIEHFISVFKLAELKNEMPFLLNFMDCVRDFSLKPLSNIKTFLDWWAENGARQMVSMNDEVEAVKIVSIHKSKGMQYDAVIIPFPDWSMTPSKHPPLLWCKAKSEPFNRLPVIPVIFHKEMNSSHFNNEYNEELLRSVIDNLNLLYVATTRAKSVLEMTCLVNDKAKLSQINDLIQMSLFSEAEISISEKGVKLCECIDKDKNLFSVGIKEEVKVDKSGKDHMGVDQATKFESNLFNPKILVADNSYGIMSSEQNDRIKYGILLHEILSFIKNADEVDSVLERFFVKEKFTLIETKKIRNLIAEILNLPEVKPWFKKGNQVFNERSIVSNENEVRRPDRVVFVNDKAIVVDYKTGLQKVDEHRIQIKNYVELIREMGTPEVEGWLLYTDSLKTEKVI